MGTSLNIAVVGCGLIGARRAKFLGTHKLAYAVDVDIERATQVVSAAGGNGSVSVNWVDAITSSEVDAVLIAATPDVMPSITLKAIECGKHVLVDKPAARNYEELLPVALKARSSEVIVQTGFNHRFHPSFLQARKIVDSGVLGELMYIRGRYGHGGRIGYENEWRANALISGGGELIDQGMHLIDLSRWFLGDFPSVVGHTGTYFWDMSVDDNAFALLKTARNQVAWLHCSWSEWKNLFSFEIFGRHGKLQIDGLGGSYGTETLTYFKMKPELGPPDIEKWEYSGADSSWELEFAAFIESIRTGSPVGPTIEDALAGLKIAAELYECTEQPSQAEPSLH